MNEFSSSWTQVNGRRMHARVGGRVGAPAVVLLHGLGVSSRYMLPLARELAPHFRVYAVDLPGFGRSSGGGVGPGTAEDGMSVSVF
jgi:pimeloyl-ACP methyl ester carboxylesterase